MDEFFSEDFLSAYADGELSPDERARIEERLKSQPDLQRELDQLRQVSELVRNLKGESAPTEFRAAVMQQIEREILLGPPAKSGTSVRPPRNRARWIFGGGSFAAAAMLLIAVSYFARQPGVENRPESAVALSDQKVRSRGIDTPTSGTRFGQRSAERTASTEELETAVSSPAASAVPSMPSGTSPSSESVAATADHSGSVTLRPDASRRSKLVFSHDELRDAEIGDVVRAMEHVEGQVWVVYLTVIDRTEGLQGFQRALARNAILKQTAAPTEKDKSTPAEAEDFISSAKSHAAGDLECVYVEAPSEKLVAALQELRTELQISELRVDEPVALAELDDRSGNQLLGERSSGKAAPAREQDAFGAKEQPEDSAKKRREGEDAKITDGEGNKPASSRNAPTDGPKKNEGSEPAPAIADVDRDADVKTARGAQFDGKALFDERIVPRQVQVTLSQHDLSRFSKSRSGRLAGETDNVSELQTGERQQSAVRAPVVATRPNVAERLLSAVEFGDESKEGAGPALAQKRSVSKDQAGISVQVLFVLIDQKTGLPLPSAAPPAVPKKVRGDSSGDKHDDGAAS